MFDIGALELLVIVIVAILVIGPKDMPRAMRTAGRWIGKVRRVSNQFRTGLDAMVREAELEEMDEKWRKQNAEIMARYPNDPGNGTGDDIPAIPPEEMEMGPLVRPMEASSAEDAIKRDSADGTKHTSDPAPDPEEPQLPLGRTGKPGKKA